VTSGAAQDSTVRSDQRIIAIGDIHGCRDALCSLLQKLAFGPDDVLVFLGDYGDRGPDTPGTVARLLELQAAHPNCVFLRGNHDAMMMHFLGLTLIGDGDSFTLDCNGGLETLRQYGCPDELLRQCPDGRLPSADVRVALTNGVPSAHLDFLRSTRLMHVTPGYVFVHAGINPLRSLDDQREDDLLWLREDFILCPHALPQLVIYGHTPTRELDWTPRIDLAERKIGLDTGAAYGGFLTALALPQMQYVSVPGLQGG